MLLRSLNSYAVARGGDLENAVTFRDTVLSRSDILGAATSAAERVAGARRVAVLATPSASTVIAVVGALIAGVPVVPVSAEARPDEIDHVLSVSEAQAWLGAAPEHHGGLPAIPVRMHARSWHSYPEPPLEAAAFVFYTAAATGPGDGVVLSRGSIAAGIDAVADAWSWTANDVVVHGLPLHDIYGLVLGILGALRIGSPVVHTVSPTPEAYAAVRGTMYIGVPAVWSRIATDEESARALTRARSIVSVGTPLPVSVVDRIVELIGIMPIEWNGTGEPLIDDWFGTA